MNHWTMQPFDTLYRRVNAKDKQVQTSRVMPHGALPVVDQGKASIAGYTNDEAKRFVPPPGGIIVFGDHTRIVKFVTNDFALGADGTQLLAARDGLNTKFLAYLLANQEIPNTGYNRHFKFLKEMVLNVPTDLLEQEAIAEALSDADALIEGLERLIVKKRLIKQGAMQDLLTAKRRLPGFSGEWTPCKLGERGLFFKGSGVRKDEANSGLLPCVRYGELYTLHDDVVRKFSSFISADVAKTARPIKSGDILFAGSGETKEEIGKCAVAMFDGEMYAGGDIIAFRPSGDDPVFLSYLLNAPAVQKQKARKGQGDAVVHISATVLGDLDLKLPSQDEQAEIARVLEDMDAEIQALDSRLEKARQVKEGMMQNLLTGRIRLV